MLVILSLILSIIGLYQLFRGRIGVSSLRDIKGTRARLVGFVLLFSWPSLFIAGFIAGIVTFISHADIVGLNISPENLTILLLPYIELYRAIALFIVLVIAVLVAYWPIRTRPRPELMDVLPQIDDNPQYQLRNLTIEQAAARLQVTIFEVQILIYAGEVRTIDTETGSLIEGKSVSAIAHFKQGKNYATHKDWELALVDLNNALRLNPDLVKAYLLRGTIHFNVGNLEAARRDFQYVIKLQPDNQEAIERLKQVNNPQEKRPAQIRRTNRRELSLTLGVDLKNTPWFLGGITVLILFLMLYLLLTGCHSEGPACYNINRANTYVAQVPTNRALSTAVANTSTAYVPTAQAISTANFKTYVAYIPTAKALATVNAKTYVAAIPTIYARATEEAIHATAFRLTQSARDVNEDNTRIARVSTAAAHDTAVSKTRAVYYATELASRTASAQTSVAYGTSIAQTSIVIIPTEIAQKTAIANTSTAIAPTLIAQNTARVSTNTAYAPTQNAQNTARAITNTAYVSMQTMQNATATPNAIAFTTTTPIATPTLDAQAFAQNTKAANLLAQATSAVLAPKLQLPGKLIIVSQKTNQLGVFEPSGVNLHLLSVKDMTLKQAVWSPNGKQLAIAGKSSTKGYGLYVTKADGSNAQSITNGNFEVTDPAWSPNGKFIAAVSHTADDWQKGLLAPQKTVQSTLDVFGVNPVSVTHIYSSNDFIESPSWSANAKAAVFCLHTPISGFDRYITDLYSVNMDGSNLRQLTKNEKSCAPLWSPDGRQIAFVVSDSRQNPSLFLMNVDGTGVRKLTDCVGGRPFWSPDSKHLVFAGIVSSACTQTSHNPQGVFIYDLDTDTLRNITPNELNGEVDFESTSLSSPSWGP
ncbi:MAG: tetratricopeptide repeat protein [Chloroflexota bacterium]